MIAKGKEILLQLPAVLSHGLIAEAEEQVLHSDAAHTISAGLSHIAQYTWLLANILDVHLAYPCSLVSAISDYGQCDLRPVEFNANVVRLNNNIVHLCFIQVTLYCMLSVDIHI